MDVSTWEAQGSYRAVGGHRIFVVDHPAERERYEPALVLHGFPTCSFDWHRVIGPLTTRRRVVALDFLGFGLSDKPDRRYSLFDQADVVDELAHVLSLESVVLISHDMGDSVAGELLARSIEDGLSFAIERRVLTNGSIYLEMAQLTDGQKMLMTLPDEILAEDVAPPVDAIAGALAATFAENHRVPEEEIASMAALVARDGGTRLMPRLIRYIDERRDHQARWTGAVERHPAPLTVVWGDADPIAVWPMAERLHATRPEATLVRLEGIGHYPMVEADVAFTTALEHALA